MPRRYFWGLVCLAFVLFSACQTVEFTIQCEDGSRILGFFNAPEGLEKYPIAILCQGSRKESIQRLQNEFAPMLSSVGIGLVTIEKRGVFGPENIDYGIYHEYDCYDQRMGDHLELVENIENGLFQGWDGRLAIIGGSEGGVIASALAAQTQCADAVVLLGVGGGWSCRDEMLKLFRWNWISNEDNWGWIRKLIVFLMVGNFENRLDLACKSPTTAKFLMGYTHKWWASYLDKKSLDDILAIKCPIFYVHGSADRAVTVESADVVAKTFKDLGRVDFAYLRLEGCGHNPRDYKKFNVSAASVRWISDVLNGAKFPHKIEINLPSGVSSN